MAPSVDLLSSSLLCAEEDLDFLDDCLDHIQCHSFIRNPYQDLSFENLRDESSSSWPVLTQTAEDEEYISALFNREIEQLPADDYLTRLCNGELDLVSRNDAVEWIRKVQSRFNFTPLTAYLAINYMDRYLSLTELAKGRVWMMQLVALACVSVAAKMEESGTNVPSTLSLQSEASRYIFEGKTIQRMELMVLSTLQWRVQSVTPFSFFDYFVSKICSDDSVQKNSPYLSNRSSLFSQGEYLIETAVKGIEFLEFKPSEIAAAVAIAVIAGEKEREEETQMISVEQFSANAISLLGDHYERKERLVKCVEMMSELLSTVICCGGSTTVKINTSNHGGDGIVLGNQEPGSPIGVLEAYNILSCNRSNKRCYDSTAPVGFCPASKRRKLFSSSPSPSS